MQITSMCSEGTGSSRHWFPNKPSTMAKTLQRMQRDGLVRCDPDPDDGVTRTQLCHLTAYVHDDVPEATVSEAVRSAASRSAGTSGP